MRPIQTATAAVLLLVCGFLGASFVHSAPPEEAGAGRDNRTAVALDAQTFVTVKDLGDDVEGITLYQVRNGRVERLDYGAFQRGQRVR